MNQGTMSETLPLNPTF